MAANTVPVVVKLLGDTRDFRRAMQGAQWDAASMGQKMRAVGGVMSNVGKNMTRNVTLPIVALGAAAIISAGKVEEAYSKIAAGTGATGKQLDGLTKSFDKVAATVPQTFDETAAAIADLNTRLGITGKPLEDLSKKFLDLSDITKTDVSANIREATRLFGDWSIKTGDQSKTLDTLLKTSQMSGIGLNELMRTVVQFGAPLRNMGFDFAESTAMLAKWEKEGVNTSTVLTGMKFALKTFARAGEDPQKALEKLIPKIRDTTNAQEAMSLGMQVFGLRAGPDMVGAIREGRFEYADFQEAVANGTMTVEKADKSTETFTERMMTLKNRVTLIGASFGDILMPYLEKAAGWIEKLVQRFNGMSDGSKKLIVKIALIAAAIGPVLFVAGKFVSLLGLLSPALKVAAVAFRILGLAMMGNPIAIIIVAVVALVAAFVYLWKKCDWFRNFWIGLWENIKVIVSAFWDWAGPFIKASVEAWWTIIKTVFNTIVDLVNWLWPLVKEAAIQFWDWAGPFITESVGAWWTIIKAVFDKIVAGVKWAWPYIVKIVKTNIAAIKVAVRVVRDIIEIARKVWDAVRDAAKLIWSKIVEIVKDSIGKIKTAVKVVKDIKDTILNVYRAVRDTGKDIWAEIVDVVKDSFNRIKGFVNKIIGAINWVIQKVPGIDAKVIPLLGGSSSSSTSSSSGAKATVSTPRIMNNGGMGGPVSSGIGAASNFISGAADWVKDLWGKFDISSHLPKPFGGLFGGASNVLLDLAKDAIVGLLKKSGGGVRQQIVNFAKSQIGVPYLWGGTSPAGFDCSGLPYWAYRQAGKSIPRIPTYGGKQISRGQIQPADIMFYYPGAMQEGHRVPFGHFKMYAGNNQTVESASGGVQVRTADWAGAAQIRSYMALGGITRGLTIAGEAGPEAVIPLTRPNRAAQVLAEAGLLGGGGNTVVKVYIDGREVTNRVVQRIATAKRRTARGIA